MDADYASDLQQRRTVQRQRQLRQQRGELPRLVQLQRRPGTDLHDFDLWRLLRGPLPRRQRGLLLPQRRLLQPRFPMLLHGDVDRNRHDLRVDVWKLVRLVELPGDVRIELASSAAAAVLLERGAIQRKRLQRRQRDRVSRLLLVSGATGVHVHHLYLRRLLRGSLSRRQRRLLVSQ